MNAAGYPNRQIAELLGCSHTRVAQVLAEDGALAVGTVEVSRRNHRGAGVVTVRGRVQDAAIIEEAVRRALADAAIGVLQEAV